MSSMSCVLHVPQCALHATNLMSDVHLHAPVSAYGLKYYQACYCYLLLVKHNLQYSVTISSVSVANTCCLLHAQPC